MLPTNKAKEYLLLSRGKSDYPPHQKFGDSRPNRSVILLLTSL